MYARLPPPSLIVQAVSRSGELSNSKAPERAYILLARLKLMEDVHFAAPRSLGSLALALLPQGQLPSVAPP